MNYDKLREEMAKKGVTINMMCAELKMSRSAFYRKCHGKTEFTQSEIQRIVKFLELGSPMSIFFAE